MRFKLFLLITFLFLTSNSLFSQNNGTIDYLAIKATVRNIEFDLPNVRQWNLVTDSPPKENSKGVLMFQRKPLKDSEQRVVEPVLAILYEQVPDSTDAVVYSAQHLGTKPYRLNWELLGGSPEYSSDPHSAVFLAKYTRDSIEHTAILGYIKCNDWGIEIICDSTSDVFPQLEKEMYDFLKAIVIEDKER